mmetsp:Transcript_13015/g.35909  ORF Transcript_13015/g.35909 Transcript_13015/m.35909 type:complete len:209 (-) Transcript_13015:471-1097(-)
MVVHIQCKRGNTLLQSKTMKRCVACLVLDIDIHAGSFILLILVVRAWCRHVTGAVAIRMIRLPCFFLSFPFASSPILAQVHGTSKIPHCPNATSSPTEADIEITKNIHLHMHLRVCVRSFSGTAQAHSMYTALHLLRSQPQQASISTGRTGKARAITKGNSRYRTITSDDPDIAAFLSLPLSISKESERKKVFLRCEMISTYLFCDMC